MIELIADIPCALVDGRWRIRRGEQREKDSSDEGEDPNENAVIAESRLSSVFLFHRHKLRALRRCRTRPGR